MPVCGYHLPGIGTPYAVDRLRAGALEVEVPRLSPAQLVAELERARQRAREHLRHRPVRDLLTSIERVITNWLRPDFALRQQAEALLPVATGFSLEMVRHGLPLLLEPLRANGVQALLDAELRDHRVLDGVLGGRHAAGVPLVVHVLSGNIPGLAAAPVLLSLALKSAVLVKSAAGDPIFPVLLAQSIAEVDAELAQCLVVTYWRGGSTQELETAALGAADLVVASGSDIAMRALAKQVRGRFIAYGHKISFAAIGRDMLGHADSASQLARRLAYDVAVWDQQGCLSPQLCYVEANGTVTPRQFAAYVGRALSEYAAELPPRQLSFDEQADVLRFRQQAEWGHADGSVVLASEDSTDWSLSLESNAEFTPTCLNRCLRIKVVDDLSRLATAVLPHRHHLEAAGIAVGTARLRQVTAMLAGCGVHRICPIGEMQRPPLSWHQGGRPRIADWVEWTALDDAAERRA